MQGKGSGQSLAQAGGGKGKGNGNGLGQGQGSGARPEQETDTKFYDSQVRDKPGKGEAVLAGSADGPNAKGRTREELLEQIKNSTSGKKSDPLVNQRLPKAKREHVKQYFDQLLKGEAASSKSD